jgi:hypothetical protein
MQAVPLIRYWGFGSSFRYLQDAKAGVPVHGQSFILDNLEGVLKRLEELGLQVTIRAAGELRDVQTALQQLPEGARLTVEQATRLSSTVRALRQTLTAELKGLNAYVVSPKRLDVDRLVNDVAALLAPGVFSALTPVAQYDLTEAAKCIAFERPTAAAFHLMRATEEMLRRYYCHFIRRGRISPMLWAPMVQALQRHRRARVNDTLHNHLNNIRLSFRNPTQHPDKVYDIQEVQDLWSLVVEAINRMHAAMPRSGPQ